MTPNTQMLAFAAGWVATMGAICYWSVKMHERKARGRA